MNADAGERAKALRTALDNAINVYEQGELDKAQELNVEIAREFQDDPESLFNQGVILERMGMKDDSADRYRRSLARDPEFKQSALNLASLLFEKGDLRAAGAVLARELAAELPGWIRERMEDIQDRLVTAALDRLSAQVLRADVGEGAKEAGECISAITGRDYSGCRIVEGEKGHEYVLEHDGCTYRARIEGDSYRELVVCKDPYGDEVYRKEILVRKNEQEHAAAHCCGEAPTSETCCCATGGPEQEPWCCDQAAKGEPCECEDKPAPWEATCPGEGGGAGDAPAPWEAPGRAQDSAEKLTPVLPAEKAKPAKKTEKKAAAPPVKKAVKTTAEPANKAGKKAVKTVKKAMPKPLKKAVKTAKKAPGKTIKKTASKPAAKGAKKPAGKPAKKTAKKPVKKAAPKKAAAKAKNKAIKVVKKAAPKKATLKRTKGRGK